MNQRPYNGPPIALPFNIRASEPRWSGFCPPMLPRLLAWYDLSQLGLAADAAISTLRDWSGNGLHAPKLTATAPLYKRPPVGLPNAYGDGNRSWRATLAAPVARPVTAYVLVRIDSAAGTYQVLDGIAGGRCSIYTTGGAWYGYAGASVSAGAGTVKAQWQILAVVFNSTASYIDVDGVTTGPVDLGTQGLSGITIGANSGAASHYLGGLGEVILYQGAHDAATRSLIRDYLTQKWSTYFRYPFTLPGLRGWWRASNIVGADGDLVATWADYSGFGNNLTAAGAARPTLKTNILNGRPVVRLDGSNNFLATAAFSSALSTWTLGALAKQSSMAAAQALTDGIAGGGKGVLYFATDGKVQQYQSGWTASAAGVQDTNWNRYVALFADGASSGVYKDGSSVLSASAGASDLTGLTVGQQRDGTTRFGGDIADIVLCDGVWSAGSIALHSAAIAQEYAE